MRRCLCLTPGARSPTGSVLGSAQGVLPRAGGLGWWWWLSPPLASASPPRRPGGARRGQHSSATVVSAAPALGPTASLSPVRRIPRRCHPPTTAPCPPFCPRAPGLPSAFPTSDTRHFGLGLRAFSGVAEPQRCGENGPGTLPIHITWTCGLGAWEFQKR